MNSFNSEQRWVPPPYNLSSQHPTARVMIAHGTTGAGKRGWIVGSLLELYPTTGAIKWAPVLWDGEDDPEFFKADCLKVMEWQPLIEPKEKEVS